MGLFLIKVTFTTYFNNFIIYYYLFIFFYLLLQTPSVHIW